MKKNKFTKALVLGVAGLTFLSGTGGSKIMHFTNPLAPINVMAETQATGTLNNSLISINGEAPITVQSYLIEGKNYYRVRDIIKPLDFYILTNPEKEVMVRTTELYVDNGEVLPKLTQDKINVPINQAYFWWDNSIGYENNKVNYFNFEGRNYFQLSDIVKITNDTLDLRKELTVKSAKNDGYVKIDVIAPYTSLDLGYDANTKVISLNIVKTDIEKLYQDTKANVVPVETQKPTTTSTVNTDVTKGTGVMTSAPVVGSQPAKILKDPSAWDNNYYNTSHYGENAKFMAFFTPTYSKGSIGGCNWYAVNRYTEVYGNNDLMQTNISTRPKDVFNLLSNDDNGIYKTSRDLREIKSGSIMLWETHEAFVEYVERDGNGNPVNIYMTEANANHDGTTYKTGYYYPDFDCKVKKLSYENFANYNGMVSVGFITSAK